SMWSIPLASVKKRSNGLVISVSTSSGGIPEKNVATTTSGILIGGKRYTRIPPQLGVPVNVSTRQKKEVKEGIRKGKRDTALLLSPLSLISGEIDHLRLHLLAGLEAAAVADHNLLTLFQPRNHFGISCGLDAERDGTNLDRMGRTDHINGVPLALINGLEGNGERVGFVLQCDGSLRIQAREQDSVRIGHVHLRVHGARVLPNIY